MKTKKKITNPTTVKELKKRHPKLYAEFLRQKNKYGITYQQFRDKLSEHL